MPVIYVSAARRAYAVIDKFKYGILLRDYVCQIYIRFLRNKIIYARARVWFKVTEGFFFVLYFVSRIVYIYIKQLPKWIIGNFLASFNASRGTRRTKKKKIKFQINYSGNRKMLSKVSTFRSVYTTHVYTRRRLNGYPETDLRVIVGF